MTRDIRITHERLMDAWYLIFDLTRIPETSASDASVLVDAKRIIANKDKEILMARQMYLEDRDLDIRDMEQNLNDRRP